ncbi:MAG: hypothetical protein AB1806_10435 [Acidobacteriota bacterium]
MPETLTIRIKPHEREALNSVAKSLGKSVSEVVRDILVQALEERPLASRAGHLAGRLTLGPASADAFRAKIKASNWRR